MKKKTVKYTLNPDIGDLKVVRDMLPSAQKLANADEVVNVSIPMNKKSVDFFKKSAKGADIPYTGMIRNLVDAYVEHYQHSKSI